ncbi:MAG: WYL domain-containing transcriptional regulator [Microbacteriaceae bacterium]|nr:WYL domain-containing transcriptional regulator [Microbacteriaceae bacterium]
MDDLDPNEYKIGKPERLFNLTCLLLHYQEGLTKNEILRAIPAYAEDYVEGGDNSSLERKFERDKDTLRHNGIMVEAVIPKYEDENNQVSRYIIKPETFYWPKELKLTPRQLALLNLAAEAWAGGSLSGAATKGINKLRSLGMLSEDDGILGIAPRLSSYEPNFREINNAISDRRVIQFDYRNPKTGEILTRKLEPWLLRRVAGQWLVLGYDQLREAPRNFMLRRMLSGVTIVRGSQPFDPIDPKKVDAAVQDLEELAAKQVAIIKVKPNTEAWFRYQLDLAGPGTDGKVELHYYDPYVLAEQLREYSHQVQVLKPDMLAQLVKSGFEKVAEHHA